MLFFICPVNADWCRPPLSALPKSYLWPAACVLSPSTLGQACSPLQRPLPRGLEGRAEDWVGSSKAEAGMWLFPTTQLEL